jgi:hypothetical protein
VDSGTEVRLFDPRRRPPNWIDLMRPTQCAVFLRDRSSSASLARHGRPYSNVTDINCIVFDTLEAAQRFCESRVLALPHVRCEIYNAEGLAQPPLEVIIHPDHQSKEESGSVSSRRRQVAAVGLLLASPLLFWIGMRFSDELTPFLAANCIILAMRFLYWDFGLKHRERERHRRLEAHRMVERGGTGTTPALF